MAAELAASAAELTAREQSARTHRALQTDDVLVCVFSRLSLRDGCVSVASVCKQWRDAWRRLVKGSTGPSAWASVDWIMVITLPRMPLVLLYPVTMKKASRCSTRMVRIEALFKLALIPLLLWLWTTRVCHG